MSAGTELPLSEEHVDNENQKDLDIALLNERRRTALAEIDNARFSQFHIKIYLVAGIGFFTDAYDIFSISITAVMLGYVYGGCSDNCDLPTLSVWQTTGLKLAGSVGNLIGQVLFGWLADMFGRRRMYGIELIIMVVATFGQAVSGQGPGLNIFYTLMFWRLFLGIGVGGDYPLSAIISSEFASTRTRGRLMTAVFAFQGWGQLAASFVGFIIVAAFKDAIHNSIDNVDYVWRLIIGFGCVPGVIALYFRLTVPETPRFTMDIDRCLERASRDIENALASRSYTVYSDNYPSYEQRLTSTLASRNDFIVYFSKLENLKVLFGTAYSWFALDISFYILTLDSVQILDATYFSSATNDAYENLLRLCLANIVLTVAGYIPGFGASFLLIDVWGRKPIQLMGFVVLTILFWIMGLSYQNSYLFMSMYCLANFFQNFGPNTTTFIIPGEVFPTRYRCTAHGISAAFGKFGAVVAQILFAALEGNVKSLLEVLSLFMMTGVFSTLLIPETKQRTLEDLSNEDQEFFITGTSTV